MNSFFLQGVGELGGREQAWSSIILLAVLSARRMTYKAFLIGGEVTSLRHTHLFHERLKLLITL